MRRSIMILVAVVTLVTLLVGGSVVMAAKPEENGAGKNVIAHSNGFPSGMHFNLNLHGRDCTAWTGEGYTGNAIIIPLYSADCPGDNATIEYLSNKNNKSKTELYVIDPLTEPFWGGDPAQVYLPYNIDDDDNVSTPGVSAQGYYVFGRSLGKPNNSSSGDNSSLMLYPNFLVSVNNTVNSTWPWNSDWTINDDILLDMGYITSDGQVGITDPAGFYRFDPPPTGPGEDENGKGNKKGKSKAVEITQLFLWTGFITDNVDLDLNLNGTIDINDLTYTTNTSIRPEWVGYEADWLVYYPTNGAPPLDGEVLDNDEFLAWLQWLAYDMGYGDYYEGAWIFDIAEMVISGQRVVNDGTKNFQIRFYPVRTTEFTSPYIAKP